MSFDRVAPLYRRLETLVFGRQLQEARVTFVRELKSPRRALVVGEGNGRFLAELRRAQPELPVECLDASARMLALARARAGESFVQYLHADLRAAAFPPARYDLLVTHFFLDCFAEKSLEEVIEKLSAAATADAIWLIADFHVPSRGWRRWWARFLIAVMYRFFRLTTGIEARRLVDYAPFLAARGFCLTTAALSPNGMIRSQIWVRAPISA